MLSSRLAQHLPLFRPSGQHAMRRVIHRAARFLAVTLQAPGRISARRKQQCREAGEGKHGFRHRFPLIGIGNAVNMLHKTAKSMA